MSARNFHNYRVRHIFRWPRATLAPAALVVAFWAYLALPLPAQAASLVIPLQGLQEPAADLLFQGNPIDPDEAVDLADRGTDLSELNPAPNDLWRDAALPLIDSQPGFPAEGATVRFQSTMTGASGMFRARVSDASGERTFQLFASLDSHAAMARSALLRKLGYSLPSPRRYQKLTVQFADATARDRFVDGIVTSTKTARARWITASADGSLELTLQDVVLEPGQIETSNYHWGAIPDYRLVTGSTLATSRIIRALIVPLVLLDIPESVNLHGTGAAQIFSDSAVLTHPYASSFQTTALEDAQWILRRIAKLSRSDLQSIIGAGQYPQDVAALLLEKTIGRRNSLIETLKLKSKLPKAERALPYDLNISVGAVVKGKLTRETYEGYALRFTYGDPDSPVRTDEILRYLRIESLASVLMEAAKQVNEALTLSSVQDLAMNHQKDLIQSMIRQLESNPGAPLSVPISTWGGPIGGFAVTANRNVVTGDYYGEGSGKAAVQLVDNISVQAQVGYFLGIEGLENVIPGVTGNVVIQRNYIHVRPVADMKEVLKTDWKSLWIPGFMKDLGESLQASMAGDPAKAADSLKGFLDQLKDGEMFMITDTIAAGVQGQVTIPLVQLLASGPIAGSPTVAISAGPRAQAYRRTTLIRTDKGLQVYLQAVKARSLEAALDFNWWINIFRYSHEEKLGTGTTRALLLDRDDGSPERERRLNVSLPALLSSNNSEPLEENFRHYLLNHETRTSRDTVKFLRWRWSGIEEGHLVKIRPPADPEGRYRPEDHERTLYNTRIEHLKGTSDASLLSEIIRHFSKGFSPIPDATGSNPADTLYGTAEWSSVSTEAELTNGRETKPVTLIENHWKGWNISKKDLFRIFDRIEENVGLDIGLIHRDEFATMGRLQLYQLSTSLLVYEEGVERIRESLFPAGGLKDAGAWIKGLESGDENRYWCDASRFYGEGANNGPEAPMTYWQKENGRWVSVDCLRPWMEKLLRLRKKHPGSDRMQQVAWTTSVMDVLQARVEFARLVELLGKDNLFFQIKVRGFKTNVENADSSAEYISSTLGSHRPKEGAGAVRDFAAEVGIQVHELYARYLGEGF